MNEIELLNAIYDEIQVISDGVGVLASFLVFFSLVIVMYFIYRFFDMMFKF